MPENPSHPYESYVDAVLAVLARAPGRAAIVSAEGRTVSAGEFADRVHGAAAALAAHGVGRAATVCLLTGNRPEALVARYAANLLGARVVHLDRATAAGTQAAIVESTGATALIVDPEARAAAEALLAMASAPAAPPVLTLGAESPAGDPQEPSRVHGAARSTDDWCIRFTGGSTGAPKGVPMAHGPYRSMLARLVERIPADERPRLLACTSLAHMAGILADVTLLAAGTVVLRHSFDPQNVLAALGRERISDLWLLPPLLYELLDHPALPGTDVSSLRRLFYGGTAASAGRLRRAAEVFGPVLHGWYGQTETGTVSEVLPHEHTVTGPDGRITAGRPDPGVEIEIRDPAGTVLPAGSTGEVHVRTPMVMAGYWLRPDLTARVLRDGWVGTGDVGLLDADGYLHIVDRLKDAVVVVGGHVYPAELEQVLLTHPAVAQCAAFGTRDADEREELHVAVVPAPGHRPDREMLRGFVTERMGSMYAPAAVHLVRQLPRTAAGKPDRNALRAALVTDAR
ncbi:class I adenylate-forming enzyme family protein [Streptomyces sp. ISL-94]|uniref:class I adenylate-forming enzyme family protein n=1 Tax=Streptomyces sp. ISL-94 TaxID=2819190 RepID=UPI001BEC66CC|nr:AMP-binding protein [Streptomyces sp. ISL-94]MBT2480102.1 AMP-binding protein [Streptomyces sp. ISL-94]